jgi:hypothetical protein
MDDDFDSIWNSITSGANYAPGDRGYYDSLDDFEKDWFDVTRGNYTIDEIDADYQQVLSDQGLLDWVKSNTSPGFISGLVKTLGDGAAGFLKKYLYNPDTGKFNTAGLATAAAALYGLSGGYDVKKGGYSTPPPKLTAVREQVPTQYEGRRPGSQGRRYFSDTAFVPEGGDVGAARTAAQEQAQGLAALQQPAPQQQVATLPTPMPWMKTAREKMEEEEVGMAQGGQVPSFRGPLEDGGFVVPGDVVRHADPDGMARKEAGLAALNQQLGAQAIRGPGDAMSDSIPTTIEGRQPAAVANGEAYVPRRMVEQLGNGSPKRGAQQLYDMMEKLRLDRTGSTKQINPDNPQELVRAYQGGQVKRYQTGGTTTAAGGAAATTSIKPVGYGESEYNTLAPWAGEYVTEALAQGRALAQQPYQAYTGPLTAGPTQSQQQAFAGIQSIAGTGFTPETYSAPQQFTEQTARQYMNPFMEAALTPQLEEMRRQADIARLGDAERLTSAGAFGGSRQAIMEAEGRRNLLDLQRRAIGEGMMGAYERGLQQFNLEQGRQTEAQQLGESSRRYSAEFGLKSLADLAQLGEQERAIEQAGLTADREQFEQEREFAYRMPQYQLGLLQGIPIGGSVTQPNTTGLSTLQAQIADLMTIYGQLGGK